MLGMCRACNLQILMGDMGAMYLQASGMAVLLNDAVDQAERLAGENKELRRKQEDAVLDKCACTCDACWNLSCAAVAEAGQD
jgi:hypothetical protein